MTNLAHEMDSEITAKELAKREKVSVRAIGIPYAKLRAEGNPLFAAKFDCNAPLSPEQIAILRPGKMTVKTSPKKNTESAATFAADVTMRTERGRSNEAAPQGNGRRWPLWIVLTATVVASAANMAEVTGAVKSGSTSAMAWTFVFSATPFFLIYARIGGFWKWFSIVGAMAYTGFCNAIALFGSMTAMDKGYILSPTIFLEAVTNFANTDYMNTARTFSLIMAIIIAGIEFAAFKNLAK